MANPVNKAGLNAKIELGNTLKVNINLGGAGRASQTHSGDAMKSVNQQFTRNPNNAPNNATAQEANQPPPARAGAKHDANPAPPPTENQTENTTGNRVHVSHKMDRESGENGALINQRDRGEDGKSHASMQGLMNGRGHHKGQVQQGETPPIIVMPQDGEGNHTGHPIKMPPVIIGPKAGGNHTGQQPNFPNGWTPRGGNTPHNPANNFPPLGTNYRVDINLRAHGNQPLGLIRQVVSQILGQHDVYLSHNAINRLINHQTLQSGTQTNLPRDVHNLVQTIGRQVLSILDNSRQQGKLIHEISKQISHEIRDNIQTSKQTILKNSNLDAVLFKNLNVKEKMHVAIDLLPKHLPPKALENLLTYRAPDVSNALMLARGFVAAGEQPADVRNLVALKGTVLPQEVSITSLRDVGQLVKVLIADTAAARTTPNLDLAVQKFVKILMANNELGVLLATVNLAAQTQNQGGLVSRSLALAQIYELISRLIQAGEKALVDAAPEKNVAQKERNIFQPHGLAELDETEDLKLQNNKHFGAETASSLRQFLEFNPAFVYDRSASVFNNPDDARQTQKDFINLYHDDIEAWLKSGNHRFVKDFDFDKPLGVVVERGSDAVFSATTARFVLVRDGSVQGWHFLKSFLVK